MMSFKPKKVASPAAGRARRSPARRRRGGRPTASDAKRLRDDILDVATELFLAHGYGMTTIEAVARGARISKRTFYHRFADKADLFRAVVHRIIEELHPPAGVPLLKSDDLRENLQHLARLMLQGALSSPGLALTRLVIAESARFPELARVAMEQGGRQEAIRIVAGLLGKLNAKDGRSTLSPEFAAQHFLQMIITIPQRRAMGLGTPMTAEELEAWVQNTVALFLDGYPGRSGTTTRS